MDFCFETFLRLKERRRQLAGSMSGGEQQMLALARALMAGPRILLVDEPSVGLAPILVARMIDKIAELTAALGLTALMAEQNFEQATLKQRRRPSPLSRNRLRFRIPPPTPQHRESHADQSRPRGHCRSP